MSGWIKIKRTMLDWQWFDDDKTFKLLMYLILTVNFKDKEWKGIIIKAGQKVVSIRNLSEYLGWSDRTTRTHLERLIKSGEVTKKTTNKYTLVTLVKWEQMQIKENETTNKLPRKLPHKVHTTKERKEREEEIPSIEIFMVYIKDYLKDDSERYIKSRTRLIDTYNAWKLNGWKDGNDKKIKNWKTKALMQLRYIK